MITAFSRLHLLDRIVDPSNFQEAGKRERKGSCRLISRTVKFYHVLGPM